MNALRRALRLADDGEVEVATEVQGGVPSPALNRAGRESLERT